ncbi:MAG: hypothetical protein J5586_04870 [Clostridia bacterium]|nr:hypothetical protein [Clostridia bacterium]
MKKLFAVLFAVFIALSSGCKLAPPEVYVPTEVPFETQEPATPERTAEPTAVPTEIPTEAPSAEPTSTPMVTFLYKSRVNELKIYSAPDKNSRVVRKLRYEDKVHLIEAADADFVKVYLDGEICYCDCRSIVPADEPLYGYMAPMYEYKKDNNGNIALDEHGNPIMLKSELIDIRLVIPDIEIYQIFGTDKNFTGNVLYSRPVPVLQYETALKLAEAAKLFKNDGYTIKIYDCYRPKSVQYILYDIVQNSSYIANPYNSASNHNRAAAVDMTLIGPDGRELDFPTPMHTFNSLSNRSNSAGWTPEQRRNVDYMTRIMTECGFKIINSEWWHFSDENYLSFIVLDFDMKDIPMYTANQLGYSMD